MPFYTFVCTTCGARQQDLRGVDDRQVEAKCKACGAPAVFTPFGHAPATHMDVGYHRAGSSDGVAWDHILGDSANKGREKLHDQFQGKNQILQQGAAAVFRQDKAAYRPATVGDIPQLVTNRIGATHPGVKQEIREGRVPNDLVKAK